MALIELTGKHAVGEYRYAIVDDDLYAYLNQWRWKAKPNGGGSNVYAVRNSKEDGRHITIRMHRVVLGLSGDHRLDVDHINHHSLDNRRDNLRQVSRQENIRNARRIFFSAPCRHCGEMVEREASATTKGVHLTCGDCRINAAKVTAAPRSSVFFTYCRECGAAITGRTSQREYCSEACRCRARYRRRGPSGALEKSRALRTALYPQL